MFGEMRGKSGCYGRSVFQAPGFGFSGKPALDGRPDVRKHLGVPVNIQRFYVFPMAVGEINPYMGFVFPEFQVGATGKMADIRLAVCKKQFKSSRLCGVKSQFHDPDHYSKMIFTVW